MSDLQSILDAIDSRTDAKLGALQFKLNYSTREAGEQHIVRAVFQREIATMSPRERELARILQYLEASGFYKPNSKICAALTWGEGKAEIINWEYWFEYGNSTVKDAKSAIEWVLSRFGITYEGEIGNFVATIDNLHTTHPDNLAVRRAFLRLRGGSAWSTVDDLHGELSISKDGILLGRLSGTDKLVRFCGEGSIITIAAPGTGKTQAQVLPALIDWKGPAIVLDVKGEIFEKTARYKIESGHAVYRFSPLDPDESHSFNPLDFIRVDPDHIWDDSRFLASMIIVPKKESKDPFWEQKAQELLTAAISVVCAAFNGPDRGIAKVLDYIYLDGWDEFIAILNASVVRSMRRAAASFDAMDGKTLDSVAQTAQTALSAWGGPKIERITATSDWSVGDFRDVNLKPTLYITLQPGQIDPYLSLLRVIIAQHIKGLISALPTDQPDPILFLLDEMPRLGLMPPIEEALDVGRQYGLKLWMFAQSLGQIREHYKNADGLIGNCKIQCFMNPSTLDGSADHISRAIGYMESPLDGSRLKILEPQVAAGPEFDGKIIAFARSMKPVKLDKCMAFNIEPYRSIIS